MARRKKINQKKHNKVKHSRIWAYLKNHWIEFVCSIVVVIISVLLTKACDRVMPNQPVVVEKIPDTIQVVHIYDSLFDSYTRISIQQSEESLNASLRNQNGNMSNKSLYTEGNVNKLYTSAYFPNAKGYVSNSSAQYFSLEMSPLNQSYVDFTLDFFDENILVDVYCISIKVCKTQNGRSVLVLEANYEKRKGKNLIRLKNIFTDGNYQIEVGFFLSKDRNSQYPNFYNETKYVNNAS